MISKKILSFVCNFISPNLNITLSYYRFLAKELFAVFYEEIAKVTNFSKRNPLIQYEDEGRNLDITCLFYSE